jgi:WD40 repeat protein
MVAAGTETGAIYLMDSHHDKKFSKTLLACTQHSNAVMDMQFSSDDSLLATASGDQSVRIIDMRTQQTKHAFQFHRSSCKQVRFKPGDENVVATCSRDGNITLWDTRCKGAEQPVVDVTIPGGSLAAQSRTVRKSHTAMFHYDPFHIIHRAHMDRQALQLMNSTGVR